MWIAVVWFVASQQESVAGQYAPSLNALVCRAGAVCPQETYYMEKHVQRSWLGVRRWTVLLKSVLRRFQQRLVAGQLPTLLHIGPNDLAADAQTDALYSWLFGVAWRGQPAKAIFVEPNKGILDSLRQQLEHKYGLSQRSIKIVHGAMQDQSCATENLSFHTISDSLWQEVSARSLAAIRTSSKATSLLQLIGTLDREALLRDLDAFYSAGWISTPPSRVEAFVQSSAVLYVV
eukprot:TRINITY_DN63423_c0_g1_i1.p1 TRINITY_DN63423_c0_g1~~TRINITY_DN63423_c0_g1_i1.p1  ORF type:complete len:233 (-),score=23.77 TRINITY_DN63423_c0_g1_i1:121-819(-)